MPGIRLFHIWIGFFVSSPESNPGESAKHMASQKPQRDLPYLQSYPTKESERQARLAVALSPQAGSGLGWEMELLHGRRSKEL